MSERLVDNIENAARNPGTRNRICSICRESPSRLTPKDRCRLRALIGEFPDLTITVSYGPLSGEEFGSVQAGWTPPGGTDG